MGLGQVDHQSQPELPGEFQKKSELQVGVCLKKKKIKHELKSH